MSKNKKMEKITQAEDSTLILTESLKTDTLEGNLGNLEGTLGGTNLGINCLIAANSGNLILDAATAAVISLSKQLQANSGVTTSAGNLTLDAAIGSIISLGKQLQADSGITTSTGNLTLNAAAVISLSKQLQANSGITTSAGNLTLDAATGSAIVANKVLNALYGITGFGSVPIGAVIPIMSHLTGTYNCTATTVADSSGFVQCNGQTIADVTSPMNGVVVPDINGSSDSAPAFLRGSTTPSSTKAGNDTHNVTISNHATLAVSNHTALALSNHATLALSNHSDIDIAHGHAFVQPNTHAAYDIAHGHGFTPPLAHVISVPAHYHNSFSLLAAGQGGGATTTDAGGVDHNHATGYSSDRANPGGGATGLQMRENAPPTQYLGSAGASAWVHSHGVPAHAHSASSVSGTIGNQGGQNGDGAFGATITNNHSGGSVTALGVTTHTHDAHAGGSVTNLATTNKSISAHSFSQNIDAHTFSTNISSHSFSQNIDAHTVTSNAANNNIPKYLSVKYIMRIK